MSGSGVLIVRNDVPEDLESSWNIWCDTVFIPKCLGIIPGVISARRFATAEQDFKHMSVVRRKPRYLMIFELSDTGLLGGEPYLKLWQGDDSLPEDSFENTLKTSEGYFIGSYKKIFSLEEGDYRQPDTKSTLLLGHNAPPDKDDAFNAWYNTEHLPAMMRVPGFVTGRRFTADGPQLMDDEQAQKAPKYLTFYDLESPEAIDHDVFLAERDSPWSMWVRTWFKRRITYVGNRIYPK